MNPSTIAYVYDRSLHEAANNNGTNFWYAYVREILDQLGAPGEAVDPSEKAILEATERAACLMIGPVGNEDLLPSIADALQQWVNAGGTLIGLCCTGLDALFGIDGSGVISQPRDDFSINGFLDLAFTQETAGIHSPVHPDQKLLLFSDFRATRATDARVIALYYHANGRPSKFPAVTARSIGSGRAYYFTFDVPKTIWVLHQGRPVDDDYDADGYYRVSDARVIGQNEEEVLYADAILFLLQNMIGRRAIPFITPFPTVDGQDPDMLLYWGGDDEAGTGIQVLASDFMASRGLPYHINAMWRDGQFPLTRAEAEHIRSNGHEVSLHYDFVSGRTQPHAFTEAEVAEQAQAFETTFGRKAECTVNHYVTWTGWAEPARWMAAQGGIGDNSRFLSACPPLNPVDQIGFSFGTAFPFFAYDDWRYGNERINFVIEPITGYEIGYRGDSTDFDTLHRAINLAAKYRLTFNLFFHPVYVAHSNACQAAIDEVKSYLRRRNLLAKHMGNDELARWWHARSASSVALLETGPTTIVFCGRTDYPDGMVVKVPIQSRNLVSCSCFDTEVGCREHFEFGQNWVYVALPRGEHSVRLEVCE